MFFSTIKHLWKRDCPVCGKLIFDTRTRDNSLLAWLILLLCNCQAHICAKIIRIRIKNNYNVTNNYKLFHFRPIDTILNSRPHARSPKRPKLFNNFTEMYFCILQNKVCHILGHILKIDWLSMFHTINIISHKFQFCKVLIFWNNGKNLWIWRQLIFFSPHLSLKTIRSNMSVCQTRVVYSMIPGEK